MYADKIGNIQYSKESNQNNIQIIVSNNLKIVNSNNKWAKQAEGAEELKLGISYMLGSRQARLCTSSDVVSKSRY